MAKREERTGERTGDDGLEGGRTNPTVRYAKDFLAIKDEALREYRRSLLTLGLTVATERAKALNETRHRKSVERGCSVAGCERKHFARGMCQKHYTRARRHGEF